MPEVLPGAERLNKPKLLDQVRAVSRLKHYSIRTEQAYTDLIRRFIVFRSLNNPDRVLSHFHFRFALHFV